MCVLECFLIGDFLVGDPLPVIFFRHLLVTEICFLVTNKTHVAKFPFPSLLVRPGNWEAQYVTGYSEEGFSFFFF